MLSRSPPFSRKHRFVQRILYYAFNDVHGYSQRPPSGRWGPDFDCTSLIYQAAHDAGYSVGIGNEEVRFSGTMLKDFEKAGFQILPFANVGISDLKIGDILLNLALHAEVYVGDGESVGATSSEDGGYIGESGDQTGHEIEKHPVVTFDKGWDYILRPPEDECDDCDYDIIEEGDEDMPMNYNMPPVNNMGWPQSTIPMQSTTPMGWPQGSMGYPQANRWNTGQYPQGNMGYPQGNLGQMNGYSQANAGYPQMSTGYGSPQGNTMPSYSNGMQVPSTQQASQNPRIMDPNSPYDEDLYYVKGIEGAKEVKGKPNSRTVVFDEDKPIEFILTFDHQGNVCDIRPYWFQDYSENTPQHLSPLMQHNKMTTNESSTDGYITRSEFNELKEMLTDVQSAISKSNANATRSSQQSNGTRTNARSN